MQADRHPHDAATVGSIARETSIVVYVCTIGGGWPIPDILLGVNYL
jgi:hypothetical protein